MHDLLLFNRKEAIDNGFYTYFEKKTNSVSTFALSSRSKLDMVGGGLKNMVLKYSVKKVWGPRRELPVIAKKSFAQLWNEQEDNE